MDLIIEVVELELSARAGTRPVGKLQDRSQVRTLESGDGVAGGSAVPSAGICMDVLSSDAD